MSVWHISRQCIIVCTWRGYVNLRVRIMLCGAVRNVWNKVCRSHKFDVSIPLKVSLIWRALAEQVLKSVAKRDCCVGSASAGTGATLTHGCCCQNENTCVRCSLYQGVISCGLEHRNKKDAIICLFSQPQMVAQSPQFRAIATRSLWGVLQLVWLNNSGVQL